MTIAFEELQRLISLTDTKTNLTSLTGTAKEYAIALASDTGELGIYDGSTWVWVGGSTFADSEGDPVDVDSTAASDGTSTHPARRDHRHHLGTHSHTITGGAVLQDENGDLIYDENGSLIMEEITIS